MYEPEIANPETGALTRLSRPKKRVALWGIVTNCNLECVYCYGSFGGSSYKKDAPLKKDLDTDQAMTVVEKLRELEFDEVHIAGGEPLLRRDLWRVVSAIHDAHMGCVVTTNATLLTQRNCAEALHSGLTRLSMSFDSQDQAYFDSVRGEYEHAKRGAERMIAARRQAGTPMKLGIFMVVTRQNIHHYPEMLDWALDRGIDYLSLQLVALPHHHPHFASLSITSAQAADVRQMFDDLRQRRDRLVTSSDTYMQIVEDAIRGVAKTVARCFAGVDQIFVNAQGQVFICPEFRIQTLVGAVGNVLDADIIEKLRARQPVPQCRFLGLDCACMWEVAYNNEV